MADGSSEPRFPDNSSNIFPHGDLVVRVSCNYLVGCNMTLRTIYLGKVPGSCKYIMSIRSVLSTARVCPSGGGEPVL